MSLQIQLSIQLFWALCDSYVQQQQQQLNARLIFHSTKAISLVYEGCYTCVVGEMMFGARRTHNRDYKRVQNFTPKSCKVEVTYGTPAQLEE
jgi:hypothetical protein